MMYTLGRLPIFRSLGVWFYQRRSPALAAQASVSRDLNEIRLDEAVQQLRTDGVCDKLSLRQDTVLELLDYCRHSSCFGDGDRNLPFILSEKETIEKQHGAKFSLGRYLDCRQECAAVKRLQRDPVLLSLARGYLGCEPALVGARIWWSFATNATLEQQAKSGQTFHYDIDGYRSVSYFFYLTDADEDAGAHVYVRGSHRRKLWRHLCSLYKSRSDAEIKSVYPAGDIRTICGKPGEGFAEDTFCFHKGSRPRLRDRLLFQVRFGLCNYDSD